MKLEINYKFFLAVIIVSISGFLSVSQAKGEKNSQIRPIKDTPSISNAALTPGDQDSSSPTAPMDISMLTTDFESAEGAPPGFFPGYCAQNGWTAFVASTVEGQISNANPSSGTQHIRIAEDPSLGWGNWVGCFSPDIGPQSVQPTWMEVDVAISGTGGADYIIVAQSPSQEFITAQMDLDWEGNILVYDGTNWVDTLSDWVVSSYATVRMEVNPGANLINYYYGGSLVYTTSVYAGTSIEQIVLLHDNWNFGDVGDFDNLRVYAGTYPTSIDLVKMQGLASDAVPSWVLLVALTGISIPLIVILRRRS